MALLITEVFNEDCEVLVETNENGSKSHYKYHMNTSSFIVNNKYYNKYVQIVDKAISENRSKENQYYELHHILPKSLFPSFQNLSYNKWNGVLVTPREHFILHKLFTKFVSKVTQEYYKALNAFGAMVISDRVINSRQYKECKEAFSLSMSHKRKGKTYDELYGYERSAEIKALKSKIQSEVNRGRVHSEESKAKNSKTNKETRMNKSNEDLAKIANKISLSNKGNPKPKGFAEKVSSFQKGRVKSSEERKKLGAASKNTVFVNKDGKNTKIKKELLEKYLSSGWTKGMIIYNKKGKN